MEKDQWQTNGCSKDKWSKDYDEEISCDCVVCEKSGFPLGRSPGSSTLDTSSTLTVHYSNTYQVL